MTRRLPQPAARLLATLSPWLLGAFVSLVLLSFVEQARVAERAQRESDAQITSEQAAAHLAVWLEGRLAAIEQIATQMGQDPSLDRFALDAGLLARRVDGFKAINWIAPNGVIRLVVPAAPNAAALGRNLNDNPDAAVRDAFAQAIATGQPHRTSRVHFYQGGSGFSVYWPVRDDDGAVVGVVNGVFSVEQMLQGASGGPRFERRYALALLENDAPVAGSSALPAAADDAPVVVQDVNFVDHPLQISVTPREAATGPLFGKLRILLVAGCLAIGLALGALLSDRQARRRADANRDLHLRALMDATLDGLLGVDEQGLCTFANAAAVRLLGVDGPEDLIGRDAFGWFTTSLEDQGDPREVASSVDLLWFDPAARARRRDGSQFDAAVRVLSLPDASGARGALLSFVDVTLELAEAERARNLTGILVRVPDAVLLMDARGSLLFLNPAGRALLGLGEGPLADLHLGRLLEDEDARLLRETVLPSVRASGLWQGAGRLRALGGELIPVQAAVMRQVRRDGSVIFSAVLHDERPALQAAAEQRALQFQFHQAQRLESLGVLAGGIAHDFNNMLVSILGNVSLALDVMPEDAPSREVLERVELGAERAAELTAQLLAYSGRGRFEMQPIRVSALVEEMSGLLRSTVDRRAHLDVDCSDTRAVIADPTQIRQLVMNLITNATDAAGVGGHVRVSVRETRCDASALEGQLFGDEERRAIGPRDWVVIDVEDDGVGMTSEVIARIFDPFFSTKEHGKGLGLAAVLGIVRGHRACLGVSSEPGRGTRFRVLIPPVDAVVPQETGRDGVEAGPLGGCVLLVDDERDVRGYLEAALGVIGMEVVAVEDAAAALEVFAERHREFALVLMDQTMPGMSGVAAWKQMRQITDRVPCVLMSGFDDTRIEASLDELGISGFLQKPFRFDALKNMLQRALGARQEPGGG